MIGPALQKGHAFVREHRVHDDEDPGAHRERRSE